MSDIAFHELADSEAKAVGAASFDCVLCDGRIGDAPMYGRAPVCTTCGDKIKTRNYTLTPKTLGPLD